MASLVDLDGVQSESLRTEVLDPSEWRRVRRLVISGAAAHLRDRHGWSYEQIGKVFDRDESRIRQIIRKGGA